MIDTLYIGLDETMPIDFLKGIPANEQFRPSHMPGWHGRLETTKPGSHYHRFYGADFLLTLRHEEAGLSATGPVIYRRGYWECATLRANIPNLAGLPNGWLPDNEVELQAAFANLETLLTWLPQDWMPRAKVKDLHLSMNFDFTAHMNPQDVMGAHQLMRHKRVKQDPRRFKPHHKSLYWLGKNTVIAFYEKTTELCNRIAKDRKMTVDEIRRLYRLDEFHRLEFRLKTPALIKLLDRVTPEPPAPTVGPPMPKSAATQIPLSIITADLLERMFRDMAFEFGDLKVRKHKRHGTKSFLAMLIQQGFVAADGTPVIEFASRFMKDRVIREAKKLAPSVDAGGPVFRWSDLLGDSGWGPCARPKPECFGHLDTP